MKTKFVLLAVSTMLATTLILSCAESPETPENPSSSGGSEETSSSSQSEATSSSSSSDETSSSSQSKATSSSSDSREGYQVLKNISFDGGSFASWTKSYGALAAANQGSITAVKNPSNEYDVIFTPSGKETKDYDLQLLQRGLSIKKGYSYKLEFGGNVLDGGQTGTNTAPIVLALLNCSTNGETCTSYKDWGKTLTKDYEDYEMTIWNNCDSNDNSNATFVISGGDSKYEFKIAWISMWAEPINCP